MRPVADADDVTAVAVSRLVTTVDLRETEPDPREISVSALHEAELTDGRRVLLLDDRGWSGSGPADLWATTSRRDVVETSRTVVGPDEPRPGETQADARAEHWASLAAELQRAGVTMDAAELERLPHDVVLSERLLARLPP